MLGGAKKRQISGNMKISMNSHSLNETKSVDSLVAKYNSKYGRLSLCPKFA